MDKQERREFIQRVQGMVRITKVVCTKSVKGRNGDNFVGWSAAHQSVQEDAGLGTGMTETMPASEASAVQGMTMVEAKVAGFLIGMQVDIAAYDHALAGGGISYDQHLAAIRAIKFNYAKLMSDCLEKA